MRTAEPSCYGETIAESLLAECEQRYQRLLRATSDYVYSVAFKGSIATTTHGPGCEAVTGYTTDEFAEDAHLWYRIIHREDQADVLARIDMILHNQLPVTPLEHRIIHKNGGVRWIKNTTLPHRNTLGELLGYDGLITDITERKEAEMALRASQERLALVIKGSFDGIWDWDVATGQTYYSPRWKSMLGYAEVEIQNNYAAWEQLLHPDDHKPATTTLESYFSSGENKTCEFECRLRHKDGTYRWILTRGVAVRDAQGKPLRMAGSHVDITERKLVTERLQQANARLAVRELALKKLVRELKASHRKLEETQCKLIQTAKLESLGTLAAGVAHEVKNPLQTIMFALSYLSNQLEPANQSVGMALKEMRDAVNRANLIIRELLTFSANSDFHLTVQDWSGVVDRSLLLVKNSLASSQIQLKLELPPDLPKVLVNSAKMEQVFINIFINSIQAMPNGGTLTVRSRSCRLDENTAREADYRSFKAGEQILITEVQDTGPGLTDAELAQAFDPFFTTKPVGLGTGLGLSVARKIVEAHGGHIQIKNAPSGGALVVIALKI